MSRIDIEELDESGVAALLDRAAAEGWNPGLDDATAFHKADPSGFQTLQVNGQFAAGISIVRQNADHGFLGLYLAAPEFRGQGHGLTLWRAALARAQARGLRSIGLDGVVEQHWASERYVAVSMQTRSALWWHGMHRSPLHSLPR